MEQLVQDIRQGLRQLRKAPLFTLTAIVTLALGIGANTAVFTLVHAILMRSLPVASPQQLWRIGDTDDCCVNGGFVGEHGDFDIFSYDLYQHLKAAAPEFTSLAAAQAGQSQWAIRWGAAPARSMPAEMVSGNYFTTLGLQPFAGRLFDDSDDRPGATPAAVISYQSWQQDFGGDHALLGATISINAQPFTVIGIAPRGFFGDRVSDRPPAVWVTLNQQPLVQGQNPATALLHLPGSHWLYPIGRVREGTSIPALQAKLSAALRNWLYTQPQYVQNGGKAIIPQQHVVLTPGGGGIQNLQQETGAGLRLLMILSLVVLLIACANIANMLLARGTNRRGEIAVRMAMGEDRGRLLRRVLTESALLGCLGGLAGLAVAWLGAATLLKLAFPGAIHSSISAQPSWAVLGFAFAVSLATGILFGLAPAWLATHTQPAEALRGANRSTRDRSSVAQHALVILQAALSLALVAGALLLTRSLANLEHQDFGVATANRYVIHFGASGYSGERLQALYRQIEDRYTSLPGVAHAALAMYSPLEGDNWGECVIPEGQPQPGPHTICGASWDRGSPQFLDAIGVPIVEGRNFNASDTSAAPMVAVVNQAFVKKFFPHQDPIGQHFGISYVAYSGAYEIVGVFRDFKLNNPRDPTRAVYIRPMSQVYTAFKEPGLQQLEQSSLHADAIIVDFAHPPAAPEPLLRQTLAAIDPNLTIADLRSFGDQVANNFNQDRLLASLAGMFGLLALLLASVGLYGVTAYMVARRTREIGVRMALGASRRRVVGLVLRTVGWQTAAGLLLGIPAAILAARLMASQLYGVGSGDTRALLGAVVALAVCALLAGLIPARRAATIDPMRTLRTD
ncbi:MAG TPA: ABC transporter permease [Terriglobales bacterium]